MSPCKAAQTPRLRRQAFSEPPYLSVSPQDSGYGSLDYSPENSPLSRKYGPVRTRFGPSSHWDGAGPEELGEGPDENGDDETGSLGKYCARKKSATLPRSASRSRPTLPAAFFSDTNIKAPRQDSEVAGARRRASSLRLPDRFVPLRDNSTPVAQKFRTTKPVNKLTTSEKLLRHDSATPDAFCYRRRQVAPMASDHRNTSRADASVVRARVGTVLAPLPHNNLGTVERQVSHGAVWSVGGLAPATQSGTAVKDGRGRLVQSGTNARLFTTSFSTEKPKTDEEIEKHQGRLASALDLDRVSRVLDFDIVDTSSGAASKKTRKAALKRSKTTWNGTEWVKEGYAPKPQKAVETRVLPIAPFKVLDAPGLRDDFYCSLLAYSPNTDTLAVGLGGLLYSWSETSGVSLLNAGQRDGSWLTSLAFSSTEGGKAILGFGRSNRYLLLMSLFEDIPRFEVAQPLAVACLCWRPTVTMRPSVNPYNPGVMVETEDLLVGDESGQVYYYSVEWPMAWEVERQNWPGEMRLLARIGAHSQQICGLSWSPKGNLFATGGNDNLCFLYEAERLFRRDGQASGSDQNPGEILAQRQVTTTIEDGEEVRTERISPSSFLTLGLGQEKHRWAHGAAVKAIAFCPWREGLVATGGGSNDKCIHFFHTTSGAALATIAVSAQVTSLIWSTTRREICATFGYAQPEHPYRIAIFSWPDCRQVAAIPWDGEHRALFAIPYPGGPGEGGAAAAVAARDREQQQQQRLRRSRGSRTAQEGCIVVAASDESVKFHEVWSAERKATAGGVGMLGGSDILEGLEGIDKEGDIIR